MPQPKKFRAEINFKKKDPEVFQKHNGETNFKEEGSSNESQEPEEPEEIFPLVEVDLTKSPLEERHLNILLKHVLIGCRISVFKSARPEDSGSEREHRLAEVLSLRNLLPGQQLELYLHYCGFNKRLDEWVHYSKLDITKPIEYPKGVKSPRGGVEGSGTADLHDSTNFSINGRNMKNRNGVPGSIDSPLNRRKDHLDGSYWDSGDDERLAKRRELEHLRTQGSMTQNIHEISRVKNLHRISMGAFEVEPWYFSPYPPEFADAPMIYICEFCLQPYHTEIRFKRHLTKCQLRHPPGREIYRYKGISFFELDGRDQKPYCRWLGLLSKLFLDHKTLYYDMDPFLFYVMTLNDNYGCHMLGYFSKEKESTENYNLACILTLPQYQRKGYGRILIQFSYELSKIEKKVGSPEKPLSDLGLLSYRAYWADAIVEYLLAAKNDNKGAAVTVDQISLATAITQLDVVSTLSTIGALKYYRNEFVLHLSDAIIESHNRSVKKQQYVINPTFIRWIPYVPSANQPRYLN